MRQLCQKRRLGPYCLSPPYITKPDGSPRQLLPTITPHRVLPVEHALSPLIRRVIFGHLAADVRQLSKQHRVRRVRSARDTEDMPSVDLQVVPRPARVEGQRYRLQVLREFFISCIAPLVFVPSGSLFSCRIRCISTCIQSPEAPIGVRRPPVPWGRPASFVAARVWVGPCRFARRATHLCLLQWLGASLPTRTRT